MLEGFSGEVSLGVFLRYFEEMKKTRRFERVQCGELFAVSKIGCRKKLRSWHVH
jgi:hypothetical protein